MTVHYTLIFLFLLLEIAIYMIFIIPLPTKLRKTLLHWLTTSDFAQKLSKIQTYLLFMVGIFFLDSLRSSINLKQEEENVHNSEIESGHHHHHDSVLQEQKLHLRRFYAERNAYLTGFTLFVSLALNRIVVILKNLCNREEELEKLNENLGKKEKDLKKNISDELAQEKKMEEIIKKVN